MISGLLSYIQRFQLDKHSIEKKIRKFLVLVFLGVNQSIFGILIDTDVTLYLIITLTKKRGDHYSIQAMLNKLSNDEASDYIQKNGGTIEAAQERFVESFESYEGDLKYYMGDTDMEQLIKESPTKEEIEKERDVLTTLYQKLGKMVGSDIDNTVLSLISQIHAETVAMFPVDKKDELFQEMAELYEKDEGAAEAFDNLYGKGTADYYLICVKEFFRRK